jgi:hypothetical protein
MGWFARVRNTSAAERVSRADERQAMAAFEELAALNTERERLLSEGVPGVATIVGIQQNVATTTLGVWHELTLDVHLQDREPYRAARRIVLELSTAPHIAVGAQVPVRVDPKDGSKVLVVTHP